jgi:aryl-alcohol dehydrogenase-like predicted oxidoreductase/murein tripeptide amidase MpaA
VVDVRFDRYYRYEELARILHEYALEYPGLVRIESIGHSYEGRDIFLATVTNWSTGDGRDKPALWVDGNIHAAEVAPSSACLYLLDHLVRGYGDDADITRCLDTRVFYICPRMNPDGAEWALADRPRIIRSSTRPYPFDEDPIEGLSEEDIDDDGRLLTMRVRDPNGPWKVSAEEPRLLVRREPTETGGDYYRILPEGRLLNYDGVTIRVPPRKQGLDLNRNFPANWRQEAEQKGAGPYPLSEPESYSVAHFIASHPNVIGAVQFHTCSGVLLRPFSRQGDDNFPAEDLWTYEKIGAKGTEITGYPAVSIFQDFRYHPRQVISGGSDEWLYEHQGIFMWGVELWSPQRQAGITNYKFIDWGREHPFADDLAMLRWSDTALNGKGYVDWYSFDHPQLGPIELGGWDQLYAFRNPPPKFLEAEISTFPRWLVWHLLISPRLDLLESSAVTLGDGLSRIRLVLQNTGWLPTYVTKNALTRQLVRGITVEVGLPDGASLETGRVREDLGQLEGRAYKSVAPIGGFSPAQDPTDERVKFEWVVRAPRGGIVHLTARHDRAGVVRAEVRLAVPSERPHRADSATIHIIDRAIADVPVGSEGILRQRRLGRTDMFVTELALGGVGLGGSRTENADATSIATIARGWARGINYFDTAPLFGESERRLGLALKSLGGRPAGLYLSTKTGTHPFRRGDYSAEATRWSVENSLQFLGVDSVDLLFVHDPDSMDPVMAPGGALSELERMRDEGKLRWIGLGVREHDKLALAIRSGRFDAILTYADYNLVRQTSAPLIAEAAAAGIGVILAQVYLGGLLVGHDPAESILQDRPDMVLARDWWLWARERGISLQNLALQFGLRNPHVATILGGADSPAQVDESVEAVTAHIPDSVWAEVEEHIESLKEK